MDKIDIRYKDFNRGQLERLSELQVREILRKCFNYTGTATSKDDRDAENLYKSCLYFILNFVYIKDKKTGKAIKFSLFNAQQAVVKFTFERKKIVTLKSRQSGFTWIYCAIMVYLLLFTDGQSCFTISIQEDSAKDIINRCKFILEKLPVWMLPEQWDKYNASQIKKKDSYNKVTGEDVIGSEITASPMTETAMRGRTPTFIFWDEVPFADNKVDTKELFSNLLNAVEYGYFILNSTPNGMGNLHANVYFEAMDQTNGFFPIAYHWSFDNNKCVKYFDLIDKMREEAYERGEAWYPSPGDEVYEKYLVKEKWYKDRRNMGNVTQDQWNQENELTFLNSGSPVFNLVLLKEFYEKSCKNSQPIKTLYGGLCKIYEEPTSAGGYVATMDCSEGRNGDYSVLLIFDRDLNQVCEYACNNVSINDFVKNAVDLCKYYNHAFLGFERNNNCGGSAEQVLTNLQYLNFCYEDYDRGVYGIQTTSKTKMESITFLTEWLETNSIKLKSRKIYDELTYFSHINGKCSAPKGYHDDFVMALTFLPATYEQFLRCIFTDIRLF